MFNSYILYLLQVNCFSSDNADTCSFVHLKIKRIKLLEISIWISQTKKCKEQY